MSIEAVLKGRRILIVDDEPDILETLSELLDMCVIETAPDFVSAEKFFNKNKYDASNLDIMGVGGYKLLEIAKKRGIPSLMLTAHAFDEKNFKESIRKGAHAYIPKECMADIAHILATLISANEKPDKKNGAWFENLKSNFDKRFGKDWRKKDREFWDEFDKMFVFKREELGELL